MIAAAKKSNVEIVIQNIDLWNSMTENKMVVPNSELADKFIKGANLAIQRLIEKTKKDDGQLVFSKDGKIVRIKARDIKTYGLDKTH